MKIERCRWCPLSHTHAHRRHAQPQAAQVKQIWQSQCLSLLIRCQISVTQTYFVMLKFNENVNGCLPIDAEAWNTKSKSHESRPEAGDDSESSDRLRQSQWVSDSDWHWVSLTVTVSDWDSVSLALGLSQTRVTSVSLIEKSTSHGLRHAKCTQCVWPSSNVWLGRAASAVLQKPALS